MNWAQIKKKLTKFESEPHAIRHALNNLSMKTYFSLTRVPHSLWGGFCIELRYTFVVIFFCFLSRNGPGGSGGTEGKAEAQQDQENDKESAEKEPQEVPTKCISNVMKIQIKAQIQYIDFEGRADGKRFPLLFFWHSLDYSRF